MKTRINCRPASLFVLTLTLSLLSACGPTRDDGRGMRGPRGDRGAKMEEFIKRVTTELELNDWQRIRLRGLIEQARADAMRDLREYRDDRETLQTRAADRRETLNKQIEVMFTPAQLEKWKALKTQLFRQLEARPEIRPKGSRRSGGRGGMPGGGMGGGGF